MKVLFLIPPPLDGKPAAERIFGCNYGIYAQPNIFILYPATVLAAAGHRVECLDFPIRGKGPADFREFAARQDFDVICFYTVFLSRRTDLEARRILREGNPRTRYLFLATEPTADPEAFVAEDTLVIRGEPENRIVPALEQWGRGEPPRRVPGISYRDGGGVGDTGPGGPIEDLDALPFPDRSLLPSPRYHNPKLSRQPFTTLVASRGCSGGCYYCVPNSQSFAREIDHKRHAGDRCAKPPVRLRSAANVVAELEMLARRGYRAFSFIDDQFPWGAARTREICAGLRPLGLEWSCLARADRLLDADTVQEMGRAGCRYVDVGIESFHQEILDYIGKGHKVEDVHAAVANLKRAGIEPELNILIGSCPLETAETIEHSFREAVKLDVDYVLFSVCTPFPYTRFNEIAGREGWMIKPRYEAVDPIKESFISYPHLPKAELDRTIRRLYRRYYLRPAYLWRRLRRIRSWRDLVNKAKAALSVMR